MHAFTNLIRSLGGGILALGFLVPSTAHAQESPWHTALKVRGGYNVVSAKDGMTGALLGFGFEVNRTQDWGILSAELGYFYKPGNQYLVDPSAHVADATVTIDPVNQADSRKNQVSGVTLRLAYEKPFEDFGLRFGVQLGSSQYRHEYVADVFGQRGGVDFEDTYNGVITKGTTAISPFVGVSFPIGKEQRLEVQVLALGYTAQNYVHVAGTVANTDGGHTSLDSVESTKRVVPHLEITYALRF